MSIAPLPTTTLVFSDVPHAMLVSAHAASNCITATKNISKLLYIASCHWLIREDIKVKLHY